MGALVLMAFGAAKMALTVSVIAAGAGAAGHWSGACQAMFSQQLRV
jgi:hypothetical protein